MSDFTAIRSMLEERLGRMQQRERAIKDDLRRAPEADSAERATARENDEVLERLDLQVTTEVQDLRRAIGRINDGTYGVCIRCGKAIPIERLSAVPLAETCVKCVSANPGTA